MDKLNFTIGIRAVTPLHFGSGDKYIKGFDYIGKSLVNVNGLMQYLKQKPVLLEKMATAIEKNRFKDFIFENRKEIPDAFFKQMNILEEPGGDIRVHIKNGLGQAYIPGSAIKGSIRTSIIKSMSKNKDLNKLIENAISDERLKVKYADSKITAKILNGHPRGDAKYDLMKALHISDSQNINAGLQVKSISIKNTSKGPLYAEVIPSGTETYFTMDLDSYLLSEDNRKKIFGNVNYDFSNLIADLNDATVKTISYHNNYSLKNNLKEYEFLSNVLKSLKDNEALINFGYGIGWVGMTGNLIGGYYNTLDADKKLKLKSILKLNPNRHTKDDFPITRRLVEEGGKHVPMGWAILSFPELFFKKEWKYTAIPDCPDYLGSIEVESYSGPSDRKSSRNDNLVIGNTYDAKIISINQERKYAEAVVGKTKGRIHISQIANAFVRDMNDFIWEGKDVRVKVTEIRNGNYNFSIKQAD